MNAAEAAALPHPQRGQPQHNISVAWGQSPLAYLAQPLSRAHRGAAKIAAAKTAAAGLTRGLRSPPREWWWAGSHQQSVPQHLETVPLAQRPPFQAPGPWLPRVPWASQPASDTTHEKGTQVQPKPQRVAHVATPPCRPAGKPPLHLAHQQAAGRRQGHARTAATPTQHLPMRPQPPKINTSPHAKDKGALPRPAWRHVTGKPPCARDELRRSSASKKSGRHASRWPPLSARSLRGCANELCPRVVLAQQDGLAHAAPLRRVHERRAGRHNGGDPGRQRLLAGLQARMAGGLPLHHAAPPAVRKGRAPGVRRR